MFLFSTIGTLSFFFQMQININEPLALRGSLKFLAAHVQLVRAQLAMVHTRTRLFHQGF